MARFRSGPQRRRLSGKYTLWEPGKDSIIPMMKGKLASHVSLLGMQHAAEAAELAVFAGEHCLFIGKPGSAKSLFAAQLFAPLEGNLVYTQFSKSSDESVLVGMPNFKTLRETGTLEYNTQGTVLSAEWAFLDEMFDAPDMTLRSLLGILNERLFARGSFSVSVPLQTAIATSNFHRLTEQTEAVVDRFLLRVQSPTLTRDQRKELYDHQQFENVVEPPAAEMVSIKELDDLRNRSAAVLFPEELKQRSLTFAEMNGFSPRRERKVARLVRVNAAAHDRKRVEVEDLMQAIPYCIPVTDNLEQNQERMRQEMNEELVKAQVVQAQIDRLNDLARLIPDLADLTTVPEQVSAGQKMLSIVEQLNRFQAEDPHVTAVKASYLNQAETTHQAILNALGLLP